jgi:general secretion pathway protein C
LGYVEDIFRNATIEPHVVDGQTQGLKITGLENTPLAGMFGLRDGDVVQAVNGQRLTSKQKAFQVLQKARNQSRIHIQLLRKDQAKDLSFDL